MEKGKSSLDPNAAPYVPFHKQGANDKNNMSELTEDFLKSGNETARPLSPTEGHFGTDKYLRADDVSDSDIHGIGGHPNGSEAIRKGHESSSDQTGEQYTDERSRMDIARLIRMFPDTQEQFIALVYSAKKGHLKDSIEALKILLNFLKCHVKAKSSSLEPKSSN